MEVGSIFFKSLVSLVGHEEKQFLSRGYTEVQQTLPLQNMPLSIKIILSSYRKESACNAGDLGSIPGSGRSPGGGNGNPLQYSCLENPKDRRAWGATVHGVTKSWTQLND